MGLATISSIAREIKKEDERHKKEKAELKKKKKQAKNWKW